MSDQLIDEIAEKWAEHGLSTRGLVVMSIKSALREYAARAQPTNAATPVPTTEKSAS